MGGLVSSSVSLSLDLSIISTTEMHMEGKARIARTTMRIMIVKIPTGSSNKSSTRHLSWVRVGSVVMESDERASVVEIQGRVGVEADVASGVAVVSVVEVACKEDGTTGVSVVTTEGALMVEVEVEEKAKERTVVALLVDPEEALLVGAGEEASEGTATEEPVVEAKGEIVEEVVVEATEETVVEAVVEAVAKTSGVEAVVEIVMEAEV